jgi:hypothetical protein
MVAVQTSTTYVTLEEQVRILRQDIQVYHQTTEQQRNKPHDHQVNTVCMSRKYDVLVINTILVYFKASVANDKPVREITEFKFITSVLHSGILNCQLFWFCCLNKAHNHLHLQSQCCKWQKHAVRHSHVSTLWHRPAVQTVMWHICISGISKSHMTKNTWVKHVIFTSYKLVWLQKKIKCNFFTYVLHTIKPSQNHCYTFYA